MLYFLSWLLALVGMAAHHAMFGGVSFYEFTSAAWFGGTMLLTHWFLQKFWRENDHQES